MHMASTCLPPKEESVLNCVEIALTENKYIRSEQYMSRRRQNSRQPPRGQVPEMGIRESKKKR